MLAARLLLIRGTHAYPVYSAGPLEVRGSLCTFGGAKRLAIGARFRSQLLAVACRFEARKALREVDGERLKRRAALRGAYRGPICLPDVRSACLEIAAELTG